MVLDSQLVKRSVVDGDSDSCWTYRKPQRHPCQQHLHLATCTRRVGTVGATMFEAPTSMPIRCLERTMLAKELQGQQLQDQKVQEAALPQRDAAGHSALSSLYPWRYLCLYRRVPWLPSVSGHASEIRPLPVVVQWPSPVGW